MQRDVVTYFDSGASTLGPLATRLERPPQATRETLRPPSFGSGAQSWGAGRVATEVRERLSRQDQERHLEVVVSYRSWLAGAAWVVVQGAAAREQAVRLDRDAAAEAWEALRGAIQAALARDPVEDGVSHPAEQLLGQVLREGYGDRLGSWWHTLSSSPAADVLRLIARQSAGALHVEPMVDVALGSPAVTLRDAAIQLVESWATPALVEKLEGHREPVAWLADYADAVLAGLRG